MSLVDDLRNNYEEKIRERNVDVTIALIGQPGAGKSSLINKLIGRKVFEVGIQTDTTIDKQERLLGNNLTIVDLPGYGTKMFPIESWLNQFHPEQYDLYLFVFEGKLHDADAVLFEHLQRWRDEREHPFFIVRNKEDQIWDDNKSLGELKLEIIDDVCSKSKSYSTKVYFTSCREGTGIEELKRDIFEADLPRVKKSKLILEFKATSKRDLDAKKKVCLDNLNFYAFGGAANALNPIPGVDVAVDLGVVTDMFYEFRKIFGIDDEVQMKLSKYEIMTPALKAVFNVVSKSGVKMLVEKVGAKYAGKTLAKYVPLAGWAIAATAGYYMIKSLGENYIDDCYEIAAAYLEEFAGGIKHV